MGVSEGEFAGDESMHGAGEDGGEDKGEWGKRAENMEGRRPART